MDIFAHGLYASALGRTLSKKRNLKKIMLWSAAFGVLPDLIAFGPTFLINVFHGNFGHHITTGGLDLSSQIYNYSHSLVIALAIILIVYLVRKSFWIPLFGWPLHIIIDMPLHTPDFFPTPFLFPISSWTLPFGISWSNSYIFIATWAIIAIYYIHFIFNERKSKNLILPK